MQIALGAYCDERMARRRPNLWMSPSGTGAATAKIGAKYTITLQDGVTREIMRTGHVAAQDGELQVYVIPVEQRAQDAGTLAGHLLHRVARHMEALQQGHPHGEDER